jgi:nitrite reductase/ring-hydroxylating ferredoxin subunit
MNRFIGVVIVCAALAVVLQCCKKSTDTSDYFTPVQFKTQLNLNLPQYTNLQLPQGYVYIPEGNKGSVVYHLPQGGYVVYDRTCSNNPGDACAAVTVDSNYAGLRCGHYDKGFKQCCASVFDLNTGTAIQKPASKPLVTYYTSYDEVNKVLYINSTPF